MLFSTDSHLLNVMKSAASITVLNEVLWVEVK
jgi:hypothetical protein